MQKSILTVCRGTGKVLGASFSPLSRRHGALILFVLLFVATALCARTILLLFDVHQVDWNASLLASYAWGLMFDIGAALLFSLPGWFVLTVLPRDFFDHWWGRCMAHIAFFIGLGVMIFGVIAEVVFWDEFQARFNFIAVDYLVYTTEVLDNIWESYPIPFILTGLVVVTAVIYALILRVGWVKLWLKHANENWPQRYRAGGLWLLVVVCVAWTLNQNQIPRYQNTFNRELAKNGLWSFFAAFRNNELSYSDFYATLPLDQAFDNIRQEVAADGSEFLSENKNDLIRWVENDGEEQHLNVVQITVESLSADFLGVFNPASNLTPELDALAQKSLLFTSVYATGTRTTRGMEALVLSLPPTPGRSLIKRPNNSDLFTLGSVFKSRGYDTAFIYGGYGYFDNMNAFFSNNGYRIVDRGTVGEDDVTFANAWGASDEDLLRWTLREADADYAANKPFHYFVMTTSNHRPYTFPEGRIDLPPKVSGRAGAVKYTDYAIGAFMREAATKPWFENTVFVIVADHCASVAGRTELPVKNYHIPLLVYAPGGQIVPGRIEDVMSQVDYAPTVLGLLNWSYASRFYGWDVRHAAGDRRALLGNYQKLGLFENNRLDVLSPQEKRSSYEIDPNTLEQQPISELSTEPEEIISYYQTAAWLYQHNAYRSLTPAEQRHFATLMMKPSDALAYVQNPPFSAYSMMRDDK